MKKITVTIKQKEQSYDIYIGRGLIEKVDQYIQLSNYTKVVLVTDENIWESWRSSLQKALPSQTSHIILSPGEQAKNIQTLQIIWKKLIEFGCDRKSLIINFGGGVIGDIGGFAASTYMRGIDFINLPTTILAQVDASVGGKTGFDFAGIKNLIGTFTQPKAVLMDVETLKTLPKRAFVEGFAEIIKHGLIKDREYFEQVTSKKPLEFSQSELISIIAKSCQIKSEVIQEDETESGYRKIVNFGHTIGHTIEALSLETDNPLLHGEAISIGMVAESALAQKLGLLSSDDTKLIKEKLHASGLPTAFPQFDKEEVFAKMHLDKKNVGGKINFTLLNSIGEGIINQIISDKDIRKVLP